MKARQTATRITIWITSLLMSAGVVAGCGLELGLPGFVDTTPPDKTIHIRQNAVSLNQRAYGENPFTVPAGTRITWINDDTVAHTVTAANGDWDSGPIAPGQQYQRRFDGAGVFPYACKDHPNMTGTIEVQEVTTTTTGPTTPSTAPSPISTGTGAGGTVGTPGTTPAFPVPGPLPSAAPTLISPRRGPGRFDYRDFVTSIPLIPVIQPASRLS